MAKIIDITDKIKNEKKQVKFFEKVYDVDDSKNTVTEAMAVFEDENMNDRNRVDAVMSLLIGEEAVNDFSKLPYEDYRVAFFAVMALATGQSYEDTENSFRSTRESQNMV